MKTDRNIFIAFILNLAFSIFEFIGGSLTGSVAIVSDAVHDLGDAASIGISYILERKSKQEPDDVYTYGYARFSVLGSLLTTVILLVGSIVVIYHSVLRLFRPASVDYSGMIVLAAVGVVVNLVAALFTKDGHSLNQKAVNLHMLEDVLGWVVVLVGAVVMHFTDLSIIDPILSIGVSLFIFINALGNLKQVENLFLEKMPADVDIEALKKHISALDGVLDVHHIHIWSMDGYQHYATMHIVAEGDSRMVKDAVREELKEHHIHHVTLELENPGEHCHGEYCHAPARSAACHHHHHH